jgi:hypothetical protein
MAILYGIINYRRISLKQRSRGKPIKKSIANKPLTN